MLLFHKCYDLIYPKNSGSGKAAVEKAAKESLTP